MKQDRKSRSRRDGIYLVILGCAVFLLLGFALEYASPAEMVDFRMMYFSTRTLMEHSSPYNESEVVRVAKAEGGLRPWDTEAPRHVMQYIYLPTAFLLTTPFALLPWSVAHVLWMACTFASVILAGLSMWKLGAEHSPILSGLLVGFLLANSELLVVTGNVAGMAVALCVIAVWSIVKDRYRAAGVLCLAISLAAKPHDSCMVWLCLLLAGGIYRKRAIQSLALVVLLSVPVLIWVQCEAPGWLSEWGANVMALSGHAGMNDPGGASAGGHGLGMLVSLQTVISLFWDQPQIYNPAAYMICAIPLLIWVYSCLRSGPAQRKLWFCLATAAALTMLPVYHRQQDTKLLLLAVPACSALWAEGGVMAWCSLGVTATGFLLTGDLPWVAILGLIEHMHPPATKLGMQLLIVSQVAPIPIILFLMMAFYLWVSLQSRLPIVAPENFKD